MPKKSGNKKSAMIATRLTPKIKKIARKEAQKSGMDASEWVRNLIVRELKKRDALKDSVALESIREIDSE